MDSDEDTRMDDHEPINWPNTTKGKGKGRATQHEDVHDAENLPWYVLHYTGLHVNRLTRLKGGKVPSSDTRRRRIEP